MFLGQFVCVWKMIIFGGPTHSEGGEGREYPSPKRCLERMKEKVIGDGLDIVWLILTPECEC